MLTFIPEMPLVTTIDSITDTLGLHKLSAYISKLVKTPNSTSVHRSGGRIMGANPHAGCGMI